MTSTDMCNAGKRLHIVVTSSILFTSHPPLSGDAASPSQDDQSVRINDMCTRAERVYSNKPITHGIHLIAVARTNHSPAVYHNISYYS